jgi:hypothetical protein
MTDTAELIARLKDWRRWGGISLDQWQCAKVDIAAAAAALAAQAQEIERLKPTWKCRAQRTADPPQDCGWPDCGCDPHANKVLEAVNPDIKRWRTEAQINRERAEAAEARVREMERSIIK